MNAKQDFSRKIFGARSVFRLLQKSLISFQVFFFAVSFSEVGAYSADNRTLVSDVVAQATNEHALHSSVENIRRIWEKMEFKLNPYREYKDVFTITEVDEVMQQLEEHQV